MAGVDGDGEVGAAALFVGGVDGRVDAVVVMVTDGGDEMPAGGEAEHANLVWIDVVLGGMQTQEAEGALCIFKRHGGLGVAGRTWDRALGCRGRGT